MQPNRVLTPSPHHPTPPTPAPRSPAASLFDETASGSSASSRSPSLRRRPRGQIGSGGGANLVRRRKKKPLHTSIEHLYDGLPAHSRPKLVAADRAYVRPDFVRPDTMSTAYSSPSASAMGGGPGRPQPKKKKQPFNASPAHDGTLVQAAGHSLPRLGGGNAWKAKRSLRAAAVAKAHMGAELRATPLGFERALREHEQGMRRSAIALADALDASREVERGHATVLEEGLRELENSNAVRDARRERAGREHGAKALQGVVRGRIARKAVLRKREAVQFFVDKLLSMTQRGAAAKIQQTFRKHLKHTKHAIKRRRMMQERLELQCVTKLQALTRRAHAQKKTHHTRLRRQSAMLKWCDARNKIRQIMEDGQVGGASALLPPGVDTAAHPPHSAGGKQLIAELGGDPEQLVTAAKVARAAANGVAFDPKPQHQKEQQQQQQLPKPSIRTRKASCLPQRILPARMRERMQEPPQPLAERNSGLSQAEGQAPPRLLYATNLTLCQRVAHAEVWENCGMLEIRGRYYTSSQSFNVRVSEREYRRFGYGNLREHTEEEKQKLCALITKDLWNTDMLFDSSAQLIEKVLIEQMPMFGDMKETLKDQISRRVLTRSCASGETLMTQGQLVGANDDAIFFVKTGKLDLKIDGLLVRSVEHGDYFGERALIAPGHRREMKVVSTQESELLTLSRCDFSSIIKEHPEYEKNLRVLKASTEQLVQQALSNNVAMPTALRTRITDHVMMRVRTKVYDAGELVVQQGDNDDDGMYFVRQGELDVSVDHKVVRELGELDFFGERALLTPEGVRTATVRTRTHCVLLALSRDAFKNIVKLHPDYALNLETLRTACQQLVTRVISRRMGVTAEMEVDILEYIAARVHLRRYKEGEAIVTEDEGSEDGLYFVRAGRLSVTVGGVAKRVLNTANYFGETALVAATTRRTATVTALSDCELLNLKEVDFKNIVKLHPSYQENLATLRASCADLVRNVLAKVVPLSEEAQAGVVEHVVARAKFRSVPAGQTLLREGDSCAEGMFFVRSGDLRVTIGDVEVKKLAKGDYVGERALLSNDGRRTASVEAVSACEMLCLSRADFLHIVDFQPEYEANMSMLSAAVKQLVLKVLPPDISLPRSAEDKIVEFVCSRVTKLTFDPRERVVSQGEDDDAGMFFVRQGELGVAVGAKRVRTLARGDYFGELALVSEAGVRTATVSCITRCELLALSRAGFKTVLAEIISALGVGRHVGLKTPAQSQAASRATSPRLESGACTPSTRERRVADRLEAQKAADILAMEQRLTYLVEGFGNIDLNARRFRDTTPKARATPKAGGARKTMRHANFAPDAVGGGGSAALPKSTRRKTRKGGL